MRTLLTITILCFFLNSCTESESTTEVSSSTNNNNACSFLTATQTNFLPVSITSNFELGKWDESNLGVNGDGIQLEVAPEFRNVAALDVNNYLTHIGGLFQEWNNAVITAPSNTSNKRYLYIGDDVNNPEALGGIDNKQHATLNEYTTEAEIGMYVKGTFDLNTDENAWFAGLDSRILALVRYAVVPRTSSGCFLYNKILTADMIFNASDHAFAAFSAGNPGNANSYYDFDAVLIHELGHFIGILGHTQLDSGDPSTSVMLPSISNGVANASQKSPQSIDTSLIHEAFGIDLSAGLTAKLFALSHLYPTKYSIEPKTGTIALHADGTCEHKFDGKTIFVHKEDISKFKK